MSAVADWVVEPFRHAGSAASSRTSRRSAGPRLVVAPLAPAPTRWGSFVRDARLAALIFLGGLPPVLLLVLVLPGWLSPVPPSAQPLAAAADVRMLLVSGSALPEPVGDEVAASAGASGRFVAREASGFATGPAPLALSAPAVASRTRPTSVVVQGGELDVSQPPGVVEISVLHMIDRLRAQVDAATSITVVGPLPQGRVTPALLRVRDEVRAASAEKKVHFVDPLQTGLRQGHGDLPQQLSGLLRRVGAV